MAKKQCPKGHLYDEHLPECPVCKEKAYIEEELMEEDKNKTQKEIIETGEEKTQLEEEIIEEKQILQEEKIGHTRVIETEEKIKKEAKPRRKLVGWIVSYSIDKYGKSYEIYEGRNQIGREKDNDIVISEPFVSQPHALILYRNGKFYIKDLASSNGTRINDRDIEPDISIELKDGDKITIAKAIEFYFRTCIPYKKEDENV